MLGKWRAGRERAQSRLGVEVGVGGYVEWEGKGWLAAVGPLNIIRKRRCWLGGGAGGGKGLVEGHREE